MFKKSISAIVIIIYAFISSIFIHAKSMGVANYKHNANNIGITLHSCDFNSLWNTPNTWSNKTTTECWESSTTQNTPNSLSIVINKTNFLLIKFKSELKIYKNITSSLKYPKQPPIYRKNSKLHSFSDLIWIIKITIFYNKNLQEYT